MRRGSHLHDDSADSAPSPTSSSIASLGALGISSPSSSPSSSRGAAAAPPPLAVCQSRGNGSQAPLAVCQSRGHAGLAPLAVCQSRGNGGQASPHGHSSPGTPGGRRRERAEWLEQQRVVAPPSFYSWQSLARLVRCSPPWPVPTWSAAVAQWQHKQHGADRARLAAMFSAAARETSIEARLRGEPPPGAGWAPPGTPSPLCEAPDTAISVPSSCLTPGFPCTKILAHSSVLLAQVGGAPPPSWGLCDAGPGRWAYEASIVAPSHAVACAVRFAYTGRVAEPGGAPLAGCGEVALFAASIGYDELCRAVLDSPPAIPRRRVASGADEPPPCMCDALSFACLRALWRLEAGAAPPSSNLSAPDAVLRGFCEECAWFSSHGGGHDPAERLRGMPLHAARAIIVAPHAQGDPAGLAEAASVRGAFMELWSSANYEIIEAAATTPPAPQAPPAAGARAPPWSPSSPTLGSVRQASASPSQAVPPPWSPGSARQASASPGNAVPPPWSPGSGRPPLQRAGSGSSGGSSPPESPAPRRPLALSLSAAMASADGGIHGEIVQLLRGLQLPAEYMRSMLGGGSAIASVCASTPMGESFLKEQFRMIEEASPTEDLHSVCYEPWRGVLCPHPVHPKRVQQRGGPGAPHWGSVHVDGMPRESLSFKDGGRIVGGDGCVMISCRSCARIVFGIQDGAAAPDTGEADLDIRSHGRDAYVVPVWGGDATSGGMTYAIVRDDPMSAIARETLSSTLSARDTWGSGSPSWDLVLGVSEADLDPQVCTILSVSMEGGTRGEGRAVDSWDVGSPESFSPGMAWSGVYAPARALIGWSPSGLPLLGGLERWLGGAGCAREPCSNVGQGDLYVLSAGEGPRPSVFRGVELCAPGCVCVVECAPPGCGARILCAAASGAVECIDGAEAWGGAGGAVARTTLQIDPSPIALCSTGVRGELVVLYQGRALVYLLCDQARRLVLCSESDVPMVGSGALLGVCPSTSDIYAVDDTFAVHVLKRRQVDRASTLDRFFQGDDATVYANPGLRERWARVIGGAVRVARRSVVQPPCEDDDDDGGARGRRRLR